MRRISISILFLSFFHCSFATIFYVKVSGNDGGDGSEGNPWRTLKNATSKIPPNQGHIIRLSLGTFVEEGPINIPPGVSVEGAGIDITIIKSSSSFFYYPASPGFGTDRFLINLRS